MTALLLALLLQAPDPCSSADGPRLSYGAMTWKLALISRGEVSKDVWGGRAWGNAQLGSSPLHAVIRLDASALPGDEFVATDPDSYKAVEGYGGLYYTLDMNGDEADSEWSGGPAVIAGATHGFDLEGAHVRDYPLTYGGGLRLGRGRAWLYVLAAVHEAAGDGVRLLAAAQIPVWEGMTLVGDYVSGEGGFARVGIGYAVSQ